MSKRRILSIATLALLIIFSIASLYAQQVTVMLHQPPPNRLNGEDLWKIDLTNNTGKTISVQLRGTATEASEGQIFQGTSSVFELTPGFTKVSIPEISPLDVSYANERYKEIVTRTGSVPAGDYQVCIFVLDAKSKEELGRGCIQQQVAHPTPPQLISPADGANVTEEFPIFTWMPPVPLTKGRQLSYKLKIVEILDNQSPIDAMQSNPAWFEKKDIQTTSFRYPVSARKFKKGKKYAWQVICFMDPNLSSPIKSEVWSFQYGNKISEYSLKLLTPKLAEEIQNPYPKFSWSISKNLPNNKINYTLKIFEVDTSSKPIDYSKEKPFFEKNKIQDNFYKYSEKDRALNEGKAYVWWVEANTRNRIIRPDSAYIIFWHFHLYDYGDAIDPPYPTFKNHNGARHYWLTIYWDYWHLWPPFYFPYISIINPSIQAWLGKLPADYNPEEPNASSTCCTRSVDFEPDARTPFDNLDDGIYFFPTPDNYCQSCILDSIDVMVNRNPLYNWHQHLIFHAWFDWNGDGDWDDMDTCNTNTIVYEHIHWFGAKVLWPTYASPSSFSITGPEIKFYPFAWQNSCCAIYRLYFYTWPAPASNIWTRFRLTPDIPVNHSASFNHFNVYKDKVVSGEVEDYLIKCDTIPPTPPDTTCQCECDTPYVSGPNLVVNGDFSSGIIAPSTSGLTFATSPPVNAGKYCITNNAALASPTFWVGHDHTSPPTGKFMVCNGAHTFAWRQSVSVSPSTNYKFCFWVRNLNKIGYTGGQLPKLQPHINGTAITSFRADGALITTGYYNVPQDTTWHLIEANWFSGSTTPGTIEIWDLSNVAFGGNDFGIDDICFFECDTIPPPPPDTTCQCECDTPYVSGPNLVTNGDFGTGLITPNTSGYAPWSSSASPPMTSGNYFVGNNASLLNAWTGTGMGTPAPDNFLMCNGSTNTGTVAWQSSPIPVTLGSNYEFCVDVNNLIQPPINMSDPVIQLKVNGTPLSLKIDGTPTGTLAPIPENPNRWRHLTGTWTATSSSTATLEILSTSTAEVGNDFGIDCISFVECTPPDTNRCNCEIIKVHINGISIEEGDRIDIPDTPGHYVTLPVNRHFDVTANCGAGCSTSYKWTITKPDDSVDTNTSPAFTYSFTQSGLYSFDITVTCSDGTTCSRTFSVKIQGLLGPIRRPPIK